MSNKNTRMTLPERNSGFKAARGGNSYSIVDYDADWTPYGDPGDLLARMNSCSDAPKTKAALAKLVAAYEATTAAFKQDYQEAMKKKWASGAQGSPRNW